MVKRFVQYRVEVYDPQPDGNKNRYRNLLKWPIEDLFPYDMLFKSLRVLYPESNISIVLLP